MRKQSQITPRQREEFQNCWFRSLWKWDSTEEKSVWDLWREWAACYPGLARGTSQDTFHYVVRGCFGTHQFYPLRLRDEQPQLYEIPEEHRGER